MYAVVEFTTKEYAVVPLLWVNEKATKCYWPRSVKTEKEFSIMILEKRSFRKTWPQYRIIRIHRKTEIYADAEKKLTDLIANLESEDSCSSIIAKKKVRIDEEYDSSSSSSNDIFPAPSKKQRVSPENLAHIPDSPNHSSCHTSTHDRRSTSSVIDTPIYSPMTPTTSIPRRRDLLTDDSNTRNFQDRVLRLLVTINEKVEQQMLIINELLRHHREANISTLNKPANLPDVPIHSLEAFLLFEEKLAHEEEIKTYMVHRLATIGGSGVESQVRRILKYILNDNVAVNYNWKGRDKLSFQKTETMSLIYRAVKKSFLDEGKDHKIENAVKDWLKYSKARLDSANKRAGNK